jgi:hypothetical protein
MENSATYFGGSTVPKFGIFIRPELQLPNPGRLGTGG